MGTRAGVKQYKEFRVLWLVGTILLSQMSRPGFCASLPKFFSYQTHTHLQIPLELDSSYRIEKITHEGTIQGLRIAISNYNSRYSSKDQLGLTSFEDPRTEKILFRSTSSEATYEIKFKISRSTNYEFFDYRDKASSELLIDFWTKNSAENEKKVSFTEQPKRTPTTKKLPKKIVLAGPIKSTTADLSCLGHLDLDEDGVVPLNLYFKDFDFASKVSLEFPDEGYQYQSKTASDITEAMDDNAHYALALTLYKKNKFGLVLRTIGFFEKNFKTSPLEEEIKFLKTNTLIKLAKKLKSEKLRIEALKLVQDIAEKGNNPNQAERCRVYYFRELVKNGNLGNILGWSLRGIDKNDKYKDLYLLSASMALHKVGEYQKAEEHYRLLIEFGDKSDLTKEAVFRIAETEVLRNDFQRAVEEYKNSIKTFPQYVKNFPNAVLNLAEVYFRTKKYNEAKDVFIDFIHRFPYDKNLWAAKLRVGEINQITSKSTNQESEKIKNIYEDIINKHPYSLGAFISQLRLSRCLNSNSKESLKVFYSELFNKKNLADLNDPLVNTSDLKKFTDLNEVNYFSSVEDYKKVLPFILEYRDKYKTLPFGRTFENDFKKTVENTMEVLFQNSDFDEILKFDSKFGDFAVKPNTFHYLNALAWAHYQMKDYKEFTQILEKMKTYLKDLSTKDADRYFALEYNQKILFEPEQKEILKTLERISDNGSFASFKYLNMGRIYSEIKNEKAAIQADSRLLDGELSKKLDVKTFIDVSLRRINNLINTNDYTTAQQLIDRLFLTHGSYSVEYSSLFAVAKQLRTKIYYKQNRYQETLAEIEDLEKSLDFIKNKNSNISTNMSIAELQFIKAKCLDFLNREKEAIETFRKIASEDKGVWGKSAKTEIEHKEFKSKKIETNKVKL